MKRSTLALAIVLVTGCDRKPAADATASAGAALEAAAVARGVVADPTRIVPTGVYASDTDRACLIPATGGYSIGAAVDYGEGQGCIARGTAQGRERLAVRFGDGCRFEATLDGDRLTFPAVLPAGCDRLCTGRATLAALTADRLSSSTSEASSTTAPDGTKLCPAG